MDLFMLFVVSVELYFVIGKKKKTLEFVAIYF